MATITHSKSEKLKIGIKKYFSILFYKTKIENWNKIGKIKSFLILLFSILPLILFKVREDLDSLNNFEILGISIMIFVFVILFLAFITKLWSWFGIEFKKPTWNENPLSLNSSKSLNFFQFMGFWFITSGIIKILFIGVFHQKFDKESILLFVYGISLIIGIKLSLKILNKNGNKKTVANTV
ncbi:hypothetical protein BTO14_10270 [Polaribacter butkevichii]|uniref:Uncharacterized protein n=1 Tax=Polaribacter butkevichii TaxID=218490 RepID=A0A2P6CFE1_9FLAO|nr:hypothetical protein BTO14_10270 [Polaribacter butkevichii]